MSRNQTHVIVPMYLGEGETIETGSWFNKEDEGILMCSSGMLAFYPELRGTNWRQGEIHVIRDHIAVQEQIGAISKWYFLSQNDDQPATPELMQAIEKNADDGGWDYIFATCNHGRTTNSAVHWAFHPTSDEQWVFPKQTIQKTHMESVPEESLRSFCIHRGREVRSVDGSVHNINNTSNPFIHLVMAAIEIERHTIREGRYLGNCIDRWKESMDHIEELLQQMREIPHT